MRTRQGETICLGEWIRLASADFPPAGGGWGGMGAGFGFAKSFSEKSPLNLICLKFWCNIIVVTNKWILHYNVNLLIKICQQTKI